jgi:predicted O-linked N-acetylglucosamine transferase (SPINDLY family)
VDLSADQLLEAAEALARQGNVEQARQIYRAILTKWPADERALAASAKLPEGARDLPRERLEALIGQYNSGDKAGAIDAALQLARDYPDSSALLNVLAMGHRSLGRFDAAAGFYSRLIELQPDRADAHYGLGASHQGRGRFEQAAAAYRRALELKPDLAEAANNLGSSLRSLGRLDEALACYERALAINPGLANCWNNLGVTLKSLERNEEAIACFDRAIGIRPDFVEAHYNRGNGLKSLERLEEAVASYRRCLEIKPDYAEAIGNLGFSLEEMGKLSAAIACYDRALAINPGYHAARANKLALLAMKCDWAQLEAEADYIPQLGVSGDVISPFKTLTLEDAPDRQQIRAERLIADRMRQAPLPAAPLPSAWPERLRIGYFSSDFNNHPVGRLMARLIERHDRSRFEVRGYSSGKIVEDALRDRFKRAFDHFRDVGDLGDRAVAEIARSDQLDIAIDLTGYTSALRPGIFACRAAPIQINYLGYPGTMGASFIDYIIADKRLIPAESRPFYTEKIIYLPDQYQAQDELTLLAEPIASRVELGLPETGVVFCAINNSYKITPSVFGIWMELLSKVEGSVLWLYRSSDPMVENLRREAERRGIDPQRLIFTGRRPYPEYVAAFSRADLYLDTFVYNAGATASDALRAGLPVVTRPGRGYTARMAASLLTAIGLPELIAEDDRDYARLALELATDPTKLQAVRDKLARNQSTMPLFDTARFAANIEEAYIRAFRIYMSGEPARDIEV